MKINIETKLMLTHILYFSLFGIFNWISHTILISIIAFFHFTLGHRLTIIDDWIFENAWSIASLSKILAAVLIFKFISVNTSRRSPFRELLGKGIVAPSKENLIMIALFLTFFFLFGGGNLDPIGAFNISHIISSAYGIILFYGIELFILYSLNVFYQLKPLTKNVIIPIYAVVFMVHNKLTLFYAEGLTSIVYLNFIVLCFLIYWKRLNWSLPIYMMIFYICPAASLLGLDPIWADHFSLFTLKTNISTPVYIGMIVLPISYLLFKKKTEELSQLN
jgi:hypothetical protein